VPRLDDLPHNKPGKHRYSLLRAIRSCCEHGQPVPADGLENEVSQELIRRSPGHRTRGFLVPWDAMVPARERRNLDLTAGAGGVATVVLDHAIDALRRKMVCGQAGAVIANLAEDSPGQLALPRQSTVSSASWVGDNQGPSQSNATLDQVLLQAHTCTTYTDLTRRMISSATPDFQDLVLIPDLMRGIAHATDVAALNGPGTGFAPLGLLQTSSIPTLLPAADSGNGGAITFADLASLEQNVANVDGDPAGGSMAMVTSPALRSKLRRTDKGSAASGINIWGNDGLLLNYPGLTSTAIPANLTRGTGSALSVLLYGNFGDLVIQLFTALDVIVNPFLQSVSGVVRVSAFQDVDIAPRHINSFAKLVAAVTV